MYIHVYIYIQGQYIHVRRAACKAMTAWKDLLAEKFGDDILVDASRLEVRFFSPTVDSQGFAVKDQLIVIPCYNYSYSILLLHD